MSSRGKILESNGGAFYVLTMWKSGRVESRNNDNRNSDVCPTDPVFTTDYCSKSHKSKTSCDSDMNAADRHGSLSRDSTVPEMSGSVGFSLSGGDLD